MSDTPTRIWWCSVKDEGHREEWCPIVVAGGKLQFHPIDEGICGWRWLGKVAVTDEMIERAAVEIQRMYPFNDISDTAEAALRAALEVSDE